MMSKMTPALKALISAPHARPHTLPAPAYMRSVYAQLRHEAIMKKVGIPAWLALTTATTITMNSSEALSVLYTLATEKEDQKSSVQRVEFMREVGLKCVGFNGVPRTINCLNAFKASLPPSIVPLLSTTPTRTPNLTNLPSIIERGNQLWTSIYRPFEQKLYEKLASLHPDLPVHILNHEYGALFADPAGLPNGAKVGRVLTSVVAVACLRAQTGVGPQVLSHLFGLRKAFEDGSAEEEENQWGVVEGGLWLAGDEGGKWLLRAIDRVVQALSEGESGSSFAPALGGTAKL